MNLRALDLNLLPVFEAVYVERSLTRAGEALRVTQPAVSNALTRLRAAFGDALFVRSGRGVVPTQVAEALIGPVRDALTRLRGGLDRAAAFDPATSERTFHIATRDATSVAIIPPLIVRLLRAAPGMRLHCHVVERREIPLELASGQLDLAFDLPMLARPELDSAPLFGDRWVCVLRRGHPKARQRMTLAAYLAMRHVEVSSRRAGRTLAEDALRRAGLKLPLVMRLPHYQPAFHAVMASDLALVAPLSLARCYDVAVRELPFEAPSLALWMFWRRDSAGDSALHWLRGEILAAAPSGATPVERHRRQNR